jgi:hypothetical protein
MEHAAKVALLSEETAAPRTPVEVSALAVARASISREDLGVGPVQAMNATAQRPVKRKTNRLELFMGRLMNLTSTLTSQLELWNLGIRCQSGF